MELEGRFWKDGRWWLIEIPCLNVVTQGKTKKDALMMIQDAVFELMTSYFNVLSKGFQLSIYEYKGSCFGLTSNDNKLLLSFLLIRQREGNGFKCM